MASPSVYTAITAVTGELAKTGLPKNHANIVDDYIYRSIDDLMALLSPLLARHRLCVLPVALERTATESRGVGGALLINTVLHMAFDLVSSDDGSCHRVEAFGEALDPSDKATAKAMSAAYKRAMLHTSCIPVDVRLDPDARGHKPDIRTHLPEPSGGWEQWTLDLADIVNVCESQEAIDLVQDRNRNLLLA